MDKVHIAISEDERFMLMEAINTLTFVTEDETKRIKLEELYEKIEWAEA